MCAERHTHPPIERHLTEMQRNRALWEGKPLLRRIYGDFYRLFCRHLATIPDAATVELGSGIGAIKTALPECITTDIFPNPWLDRVENAYRLTFADDSLANLILFDVFHHLRYPGTALQEFFRVLRPGGRVLLFEPAAGLLGRFVYGSFHHEPLGLNEPIIWQAPDGANLDSYYAAQGNAWRIFRQRRFADQMTGWVIRHCQALSAISYVASGGFSRPSLYPLQLYPVMRTLDRIGDLLPDVFATRLLVVLEKCETA